MFKIGDKVKRVGQFSFDGVRKGDVCTVSGIANTPEEGIYLKGHNTVWFKADYFVPAERPEITWDNLRVGDYIRMQSGSYAYRVDKLDGDIVFLFKKGREDYYVSNIPQLKEYLWLPVQPPKKPKEVVKELTVADVEKLVGTKVKIVK